MKIGPEMEPQTRIKAVADLGSNITVDPQTKATIYIKSGKEMLRSAINYHEDGNPESAYILYIRFLTIFVEKIKRHPDYKSVPASDRKLMTSYCNNVLDKAATLKTELVSKYEKEYEEYQIQLKLQEEAAAKAEAEAKKKNSNASGSQSSQIQPSLPSSYLPSSPAQPSQNDDYGLSSLSGLSYPLISDGLLPSSSQTSASANPGFDRSTKPNRFLSPMSTGMRSMIIPGDLITKFLQLAERNTLRNVETCGFLTGRIQGGKLVVTDLIIPKQTGTSDSCTTMKEEESFLIQDKYDLITFGWIHTHPSQTAFLSSIDMHTHFCYQSMMPEAIAIVCAPSKNEVGTFVLTPNEGMEIIGSCQKTDFHPHPNAGSPLFMDATHHFFDTNKYVRVHDLR